MRWPTGWGPLWPPLAAWGQCLELKEAPERRGTGWGRLWPPLSSWDQCLELKEAPERLLEHRPDTSSLPRRWHSLRRSWRSPDGRPASTLLYPTKQKIIIEVLFSSTFLFNSCDTASFQLDIDLYEP